MIITDDVKEDFVVDSSGNSLIPSLYLSVDGRDYFGRDARDKGRLCGRTPIKELKTKVRGQEYNLKYPCGEGDNSQTYGEILKKMLGYILKLTNENIEKKIPDSIEYITITAPVSLSEGGIQNTQYNSFLKNAIKEYTGLDDEHIFVKEEPVMAAYSYICNKKPNKNQKILVFDLGGGTLDTSIVNYDYSKDVMDVVGTSGKSIGGNDWTDALFKLIQTKAVDFVPKNYNYEPLRDNVENLKTILSTKDSGLIQITLDDGSVKSIKVSRNEFEVITSDLLKKCMEHLNNMMRKLGCKWDDIDKVVLVGGGSYMPQITDMFLGYPGMSENKIYLHMPSLAISNGAVLFTKKNYKQSGGIEIGPYVEEIASHTYGVEVDNTYHNAPLIKNIIFRGDKYVGGKVYCSPDCTFQPASDTINHVLHIKVYESNCLRNECDDDGCINLIKDAIPVGKPIRIPIPKGYANKSTKYKIRIAFILTSDGILTVRVTEVGSGRILTEVNINNPVEE